MEGVRAGGWAAPRPGCWAWSAASTQSAANESRSIGERTSGTIVYGLWCHRLGYYEKRRSPGNRSLTVAALIGVAPRVNRSRAREGAVARYVASFSSFVVTPLGIMSNSCRNRHSVV